MDGRRTLALCGIAFVALVLVAVVGLGSGSPDSGSAASTVAAYYHGHRDEAIASAFLAAAAAPFLVLFAAALVAALEPEPGVRRGPWPVVLVVGTAVAATGLVAGALLHFAVADAAGQDVSADGLRLLSVLDADSWVAWNSGLGIMLLGAAGCLLAPAVARRFLGFSALVLGVLLFVPFADFAALLLTGVWTVATGVVLARTPAPGRLTVATAGA